MQFIRNRGRINVGLAGTVISIVSAASIHAGDKIQFSEPARKTELPTAGPRLEEFSRSYESFTKGSVDGAASSLHIAPLPSQSSSSPSNLRMLEEYIDRKKNWIFETPKNSAGRNGPAHEQNSLLSPSTQSMDGRNPTVMENFFNERDRQSNSGNSEKRNSPFEAGPNLFRAQDERYSAGGLYNNNAPNMEFNINNHLRSDRVNGDDSRRLGSPLEIRSPYSSGFDNLKSEKEIERERAEETRQAEFQKILQPRNLMPSIGGTVDVLNRQVDTTRQEANPIAPRSYDSPLLGMKSDSSSPLNSPLTAPKPLIGGASVAESLAIQNPLVNPLKPSSILPTASAPSFTPAPFVLDIQRRKF
ncbi:MAG: hypothetical protein ACO1QB_02410 [Verrucomicrobiales bacterium]